MKNSVKEKNGGVSIIPVFRFYKYFFSSVIGFSVVFLSPCLASAIEGDLKNVTIVGGSNDEAFYKTIETFDNQFVSVGYTSSNFGTDIVNKGAQDAFIVKQTQDGVVQWKKSIGGSLLDEFIRVSETSDGGYLAVGNTSSIDGDITNPHGASEIILAKYDPNGTRLWVKYLGGSGNDTVTHLAKTIDSGYVLVGTTTSINGDFAAASKGGSDSFILKIDENGNKLWMQKFGGSSLDSFTGAVPLSDGTYLVSGYSRSTTGDFIANKGSFDLVIGRISSTGTKIWFKSFGGSGADYAERSFLTNQNEFVVVGETNSSNGDFPISKGGYDAFAMTFDLNGNKKSTKTFGGSNDEYLYHMVNLPNGDMAYVGTTYSSNGDFLTNKGQEDSFLYVTNSTGVKKWAKTYGGSGSDRFLSGLYSTSGHILLTGISSSNNQDIPINFGLEDAALLYIEGPDFTPPSNVTHLSETHDGLSSTLTWTNPSDSDYKETRIYRNGMLIHTTTGTSFTDGSLQSETLYTYKITTVDWVGNESIGASLSLTTNDITSPSIPTNIIALGENKSLSLSWDANSENDLAGYNIYIDGVLHNSVPVTSPSYQIDGLVNHHTYDVSVSSVDTSGNQSPKSNVVHVTVVDTEPPHAPQNLVYSSDQETVHFSWSANNEDDLLGYNLYIDNVLMNSSPLATPFFDTVLSIGTHEVKMSAVDTSNLESAYSPILIVTIQDTLPPLPVANLQETHSGNHVQLTWNNPTDSDYKETRIYRNGVLLATTTSDEFWDDSVQSDTLYSYVVSTVDFYHNESETISVFVRTNDITAPLSPAYLKGSGENSSIHVSWNSNVESDLLGYIVYLNGVKQNTFPIIDSFYTFLNLLNRESYEINVSAIDRFLNESIKSDPIVVTVKDTLKPDPPRTFTFTQTEGIIHLSWLLNTESDIVEYRLYVNNQLFRTFSADTSFYDLSINAGVYDIKLTAVDSSGNESIFSDILNVTQTAPPSQEKPVPIQENSPVSVSPSEKGSSRPVTSNVKTTENKKDVSEGKPEAEPSSIPKKTIEFEKHQPTREAENDHQVATSSYNILFVFLGLIGVGGIGIGVLIFYAIQRKK